MRHGPTCKVSQAGGREELSLNRSPSGGAEIKTGTDAHGSANDNADLEIGIGRHSICASLALQGVVPPAKRLRYQCGACAGLGVKDVGLLPELFRVSCRDALCVRFTEFSRSERHDCAAKPAARKPSAKDIRHSD